MKRRVFTILSALSLALCVATCGLWARSYWATQFIGWSDGGNWYGALSWGGILRVERGNGYFAAQRGWTHASAPVPQTRGADLWNEVAAPDRMGGPLRRIGMAYVYVDYGRPFGVRRAVYLPHGFIAGLLGFLPAVSVWKLLRRRRGSRAGLCPTCGYDLRATPERCPECGRAAGAE